MTLKKTTIPGAESVEVPEKKPRRRFTMDEKRRIVAAADACSESGEIHALLRREGMVLPCKSGRSVKKPGLFHSQAAL